MTTLKRLVITMVFATFFLSAAHVVSVRAQSAEGEITPAHIERIRANCSSAQLRLNQLHATDALLRVNRGQVYESISAKLMATMNGRIALNRMNGGDLVNIAARYEDELITFRGTYQSYEQRMSELLRLDCTKQPVTFYDGVAEVRSLREQVHAEVVKLHVSVADYQAAFQAFLERFVAEEAKMSE